MRARAVDVRDVVLLGGGHAHVQVLKRFGMKPEAGVRLTCIAREAQSPYSGMLPGHVAGQYAWDEIHVDLVRLCSFADARFIDATVSGIDVDARTVHLENRPSLRYDVVSVNVGGEPGLLLPGREYVIAVKPIGQFLPAWNALLADTSLRRPFRIAVVGGGPGSVELALAIKERHGARFHVDLVTAATRILPEHARGVGAIAMRELDRVGVAVQREFEVERVMRLQPIDGQREGVALCGSKQQRHEADCVLWVGGVDAPPWIEESGIATDEQGFLQVNRHLQSTSHPNVFAAGDSAAMLDQPRPKSGVYAVRQGKTLASNLRAAATNRSLDTYYAQRHALALLRFSDRIALASRGPLVAKGRLWGIYKDWIDRRFMQRFADLPVMSEQTAPTPELVTNEISDKMRCGGCGAKLGADVLSRVLRRLELEAPKDVVMNIGEDAAIVDLQSTRFATSCDGFRTMVSDPWMFGRIAAHHALNDLYAMGSKPRIALALATVPLMADAMMEEDLFQMMSGSVGVFAECGVRLVGGHSAEGMELSLGFAVTGTLANDALDKGGLRPGQRLVLTKAVGTGVNLAALMQLKSDARWVSATLDSMNQSNAAAMEILQRYGVTGCTDITGFGLLGHIAEMVRSSRHGVVIDSGSVPLLDGALNCLSQGVESSLQANNEQAFADCDIEPTVDALLRKLLVDPQTCGGLVGSVPEEQALDCVTALHQAGYSCAGIIGRVAKSTTSTIHVT